jgi:hypothetical protein
MSLLQTVRRGTVPRAQRVVLYGVESVGKTTLAAQAPTPLFLDVEDGTAHLDVPRLSVKTWSALEQAVKEVAAGGHEFRTLVIDSVDWAEKLAVEHMLEKDKKSSVEDYGYGKGYVLLAEKMTRWLATLDMVVARGVHVLLIAHAKVARHEPPDGMQAYDRYELKLSKQSSPLIKEWADALLFANFKTRVLEAESGRAKGVGGKERVLYTQRCAAWDAKCRASGVPEEIPMTWAAVAPIFGDVQPSPAAKPSEEAKPEPSKSESAPQAEAVTAPATAPAKSPSLQEQVFFDVLRGTMTESHKAVVALRAWGWLQEGQELSALSDHHCKQILARPDAFRKRLKEFNQ